MNQIIDIVTYLNNTLNHFIWGPFMLLAFLSIGLMFTLRTRVFQLTHIKYWLEMTFFQLFKNQNVLKTHDSHAISQFQSSCTALAASIGTGNIAGVATAIATGGPGSIFWMWLSAFLGMMTIYAENVLGIKYRYRNESGDWIGGAMIYMEKGLHAKWLAVVYSIFCLFSSFGIGNMTQSNSIACGLKDSFGINPRITAFLLMLSISVIVLGGIKRIAQVTEKFVPFMAFFYILGGCIVILSNIRTVPYAFQLIFSEAFRIKSAGSGFLGYGIAVAMRKGISRGIFSNEAGLGSSVMAHSTSDIKEPAIQGMWGIFEVFIDTIVICTITSLAILTSGVYHCDTYCSYIALGLPVVSGTTLTSTAFSSVIPFGGKFVTIAIIFFAFSTLLGWSYYGSCTANYLFGAKAVMPYKIIFIGIIYCGCVSSLNLVWDISDTMNGFMAVPNLLAITLLSKEVLTIHHKYISQK